jgi:SiaC family regulatory phosphoprotein
MELINIQSTPLTPSIKIDSKQGKLEIKGISIPENANDFFKPLIESLDRYSSSPGSSIQADIQLVYFNTKSAWYILRILRCLEEKHRQGYQVVVNWYYEKEDQDMFETGEDFQAVVNLTFNMILVNPE